VLFPLKKLMFTDHTKIQNALRNQITFWGYCKLRFDSNNTNTFIYRQKLLQIKYFQGQQSQL